MSTGNTNGGTPAELYNKRRSQVSEIEEMLDSLDAVLSHDLRVDERAAIIGDVRLHHKEPWGRFNQVLDARNLEIFALTSVDKRDDDNPIRLRETRVRDVVVNVLVHQPREYR